MRLREGMRCPFCGTGNLSKKQRDLDFEYKGTPSHIEGVNVYECQNCSDYLLDSSEERKIERFLTDERRKVDGLLTSDKIKDIRLSFDKTQEEFATILGVGLKTFARYESGHVTQSRTMDHLLRILKKHPYIMEDFDPNWSKLNVLGEITVLRSHKPRSTRKACISRYNEQTISREGVQSACAV